MTIEFENTSNQEVGLDVKKINRQTINNAKKEYIAPKVVLSDKYGGAKEIGEIVNVCTAKAFDVLDPAPNINLTIYDTNEEIVRDIDGNLVNSISCDKDVYFEITNYGEYRVNYHAFDASNNRVNVSYVISVYDKEAPVITLSGSNPESARINSTIQLAIASVTDNVTASKNIVLKVYVVLPSGYMEEVLNYSYTFTSTGLHVVRYFAFDEAGNVAILDTNIMVS